MRQLILQILILLLSCDCAYSFPFVLAPEEVQDVKTNVAQSMKDYYQELNLLTNGPEKAEERMELVNHTIRTFYDSARTPVYNDYENGNKKIEELYIDEYLQNLAVHFSDEKLGFGFSESRIAVSDVFVENTNNFFFVKVQVDRNFYSSTNSSYNNTLSVDYYVKFYPNTKNYKIYSMARHSDNIASFIKATIQAKEELVQVPENGNASVISVAQPSFFVFNIAPSNTEVKIDGKVTYVVNGMKVPVPAGKHKIELSAKGYKSYSTEEFIVKEGQNSFATMLEERIGSLSVFNSSQKEIGASIYIDGKLAGTIPSERIPLAEGKHAVRFIKQGFFIKSRKININSEKDESIHASLVNIENTKKGVAIAGNVMKGILGGH